MQPRTIASRNTITLFRVIQLSYVVALLITIHTLIDNNLPFLLDISTIAFTVMGFAYALSEGRRVIRTHDITPTSFFYIQSPIIAMNVSHILFWIYDPANPNYEPRIVLFFSISGLILYVRSELMQGFNKQAPTPELSESDPVPDATNEAKVEDASGNN